MSTASLPPAIVDWLTDRRQAVLITRRADGSAQSSNVATTYRPGQHGFVVSVTDGRAKTRNLRRNPDATLHVLGPDFGSYLSVRVRAELGRVSTSPGDAAGQQLLAAYEAITARPHPDPDQFFDAMVDDRRLLLTLQPLSWSGWRAD